VETVEGGPPKASGGPGPDPWKLTRLRIVSDRRCDGARSLAPELISLRGDVPRIETVRSLLESLRGSDLREDRQKCEECNKRGSAELFEKGNTREAYVQLQKGMLGTEESKFSKLLTLYFRECLEYFCAHEIDEGFVDNFNLYMEDMNEVVLVPRYYHLRKAISNLIREAKKAGCISEAIRLRKEMIFFTLLEGPQNDHLREQGDGDYYLDLERRLENHIRRLHHLIATKERSNEK
jgi:hypothetical protein